MLEISYHHLVLTLVRCYHHIFRLRLISHLLRFAGVGTTLRTVEHQEMHHLKYVSSRLANRMHATISNTTSLTLGVLTCCMNAKFWVNSLKYHLLLRSWQIGTNQFKTPINTSSPPILGTNHMITKTWMRYRSFFICLVETFANWFYLMWWEFYAADMCSFAVVLFNLPQEWYECTSYIAGYYTNSSSTICWEKPVWWSNKPILAKKYWPHGLGEVCIW